MVQAAEVTKFNSVTMRVETPEGTMFVSVMEDGEKKPCGMQIHIGKAGAPIAAWATAMARVCSVALEHGVSINDLITEFSMQSSDRIRVSGNGIRVHSGPEGIGVALMMYRAEKYQELRKTLGIPHDDDNPKNRPARLGS